LGGLGLTLSRVSRRALGVVIRTILISTHVCKTKNCRTRNDPAIRRIFKLKKGAAVLTFATQDIYIIFRKKIMGTGGYKITDHKLHCSFNENPGVLKNIKNRN
jgi:hypothetical protein